MISDDADRLKDVQENMARTREDIASIKQELISKRKPNVMPDLDENGNMVTVHWTELQTNPYSAHKLSGDIIKSESGVPKVKTCKLKGEAKHNSVAPSKSRQVIFDKIWAITKTEQQLENVLSSLTEDELIDFMREVYKHYHSRQK